MTLVWNMKLNRAEDRPEAEVVASEAADQALITFRRMTAEEVEAYHARKGA